MSGAFAGGSNSAYAISIIRAALAEILRRTGMSDAEIGDAMARVTARDGWPPKGYDVNDWVSDLRRAGLSERETNGALRRAIDSAFYEGNGAVDPPANDLAINLSGATLTPAQWASANIPVPRVMRSVSCSASIPG